MGQQVIGQKKTEKVQYCDVGAITHSHKLVSVVISCYQWLKVVENIRCTTSISDAFVDYSGMLVLPRQLRKSCRVTMSSQMHISG